MKIRESRSLPSRKPRATVPARTLKKLTAEGKKVFSAQLLLHEICNGDDWAKDGPKIRNRIMSLAHRLQVEPDAIRSILDDILHHEVKVLLKPFSTAEDLKWKRETVHLQKEILAWETAHKQYNEHRSTFVASGKFVDMEEIRNWSHRL